MHDRVAASPLREVVAALRKGPARVTLRGAVLPSRPYIAAALHRALDAPLLVVTAGNREAERFRDEAAFWLPRAERVLLFPAREVLPFEPLSPEPGIAAERIATLAALAAGGRPLVVAPLEAVLQYLIPKGKLLTARIDVGRGAALDPDRFRRHLAQWGYRPAERVAEPGEFAVRGGIVDLFPPGEAAPVRVELFGDEVDSLHRFDPETQRNTGPLERVVVLPARELFLDGGVLGALKRHLVAPEGGPAGGESWLAQQAAALPGLEHYGAALLHSRQRLPDYFAAAPVLLLDEWPDLETRAGKLAEEIDKGVGRAGLPGLAVPERVFLPFEQWRRELADQAVVQLDLFGLSPEADREIAVETATGRAFLAAGAAAAERGGHLPAAVRRIAAVQADTAVVVVARTGEDAGRIRELCREQGLGTAPLDPAAVPAALAEARPGAPRLTWGPPEEGFTWPAAGLAVFTEDDLFGTRVRAHAVEGPARGSLLPDFALLRPGDLLVHTDYGIGRFGGLVRLPAGDGEGEFVLLLYEGDAKLYVPVGALDRVQRYIAAEGARPAVDRLGGRGWVTTKKRAKKAILSMARELLELAAVRQHAPGHAFAPDTPWQAEFEMAFEYQPTRDQLRAAEETKADMERPHPMDRLVCGDVGYGKTEVAMRAAFKAVMDGKQVALLAPTTVLAQQHFTTFRERFAPWPARIAVLSRFVTPAEQRRVVAALARGEVDVLVGTHRILGKDVVFPDLGLLIVDEEQRFGVRHKEALKRLRASVDVLTLTATPIPRTLHLSLSGLRELSLIATPPENRLAIQTVIARFEAGLVADAVRREIARGGQVFFVHNRVRSIFRIAQWLGELVPEARIGVGHGQMGERELSRVMAAFRAGELDVLVSTSIVESGLDIPNANTMLVNRADAFGLAELYQLRGRIGRSRHRAYAYLLVPGEEALTATARRRIEVLREYSHLGAGFQVALYDLEIRGAGNIVGYEQSGHIAALGFELYAQLLRETIGELQGEPVPEERPTQVAVALPTGIPEAYVPEVPQRLGLYKRIAAARTDETLGDLAAELRERYGPLPPAARNLVWVARLRLAGEALGLERIDWRPDAIELAARRGATIPPERVVALVGRSGGRARLVGEARLAVRWAARDDEGRLAEALGLLASLGAPAS